MLIGELSEITSISDSYYMIISTDSETLRKISRENFLRGIARDNSRGVIYTPQGTHPSSGFDIQGTLNVNNVNYDIYLPKIEPTYESGIKLADVGGESIYMPYKGITEVYVCDDNTQVDSIIFENPLGSNTWDEFLVYIKNEDASSQDFTGIFPIKLNNLDWYETGVGPNSFVYSVPSSVNSCNSLSISIDSEAGTGDTRIVTGLTVNTWPGSLSYILKVYAIKL